MYADAGITSFPASRRMKDGEVRGVTGQVPSTPSYQQLMFEGQLNVFPSPTTYATTTPSSISGGLSPDWGVQAPNQPEARLASNPGVWHGSVGTHSPGNQYDEIYTRSVVPNIQIPTPGYVDHREAAWNDVHAQNYHQFAHLNRPLHNTTRFTSFPGYSQPEWASSEHPSPSPTELSQQAAQADRGLLPLPASDHQVYPPAAQSAASDANTGTPTKIEDVEPLSPRRTIASLEPYPFFPSRHDTCPTASNAAPGKQRPHRKSVLKPSAKSRPGPKPRKAKHEPRTSAATPRSDRNAAAEITRPASRERGSKQDSPEPGPEDDHAARALRKRLAHTMSEKGRRSRLTAAIREIERLMVQDDYYDVGRGSGSEKDASSEPEQQEEDSDGEPGDGVTESGQGYGDDGAGDARWGEGDARMNGLETRGPQQLSKVVVVELAVGYIKRLKREVARSTRWAEKVENQLAVP